MALRLWDLTKVLLLKRDLIHLKLASVQIFEDARVAGKVEAQAVGVERLIGIPSFFIYGVFAVFPAFVPSGLRVAYRIYTPVLQSGG